MAIALGVACFGMFRVAVADTDLYYQSLTNLGPYASSRVLLMNNDMNSLCPIRGQGYHDTSNTVEVGQTYWWHDDIPVEGQATSTKMVNDLMNLQTGINHILYQKRVEGDVKLWELIECRAGSAACQDSTYFCYLPWSSTCEPIDAGTHSVPPKIPNEWVRGSTNSNGIKQVACITMRASKDAKVYSPKYADGIGDVYFDCVNLRRNNVNSRIAVEVATYVKPHSRLDFFSETEVELFAWERVPCEVYWVDSQTGAYDKDEENTGSTSIRVRINKGYTEPKYMRVKVPVNRLGQVRFRIIRDTDGDAPEPTPNSYGNLDYSDLILIDNIIVTYPSPKVILTPTGIDSEGTGFAKIGRVGAFTEPILSKGLENVIPRMKYSVDTEGLPSFINWEAQVVKSDLVWRWRYLNQAYGPWSTNGMVLAENWLTGTSPITVTNRIGDLEYYYEADVKSTAYRFVDFANDTQIPFPESGNGLKRLRYPDATVAGVSNYWSRIREGVSPWQEMHLEATVITNAEKALSVTNSWTMELIGDHMWRGFVHTPTNYAGCVANIRFVGRNMWESNGIEPAETSKTWHFPVGEITEIPMSGVAATSLDGEPQDIVLDATSGYLVFEFNDISGAFTMNRAEYQDFNKWMPSAGQENKYIGDFVNTSYVGRAKQEFALDMSRWKMSEPTSEIWGENFDISANNVDHRINVPFGLNKSTPNGWIAGNGMFVNALFSASSPDAVTDRALQLQGRGVGTLSLIDPQHVPNGIGTVSFSARLAQYIDFSDFYCYQDGSERKNYAISAKAVLTHLKKDYSDVSTGSPSLSLVAFYRPSRGCYEFRITRASAASSDDLWGKGKVRLDINKWYKDYNPDTGSSWACTNLINMIADIDHCLIPDAEGTDIVENKKWASIYFAAYNTASETFLEGGVSTTLGENDAYTDLKNATMRVVSCSDTAGSRLLRGSYGVGVNECPGAFTKIQIHNLTGIGPYKSDNKKDSVKAAFPPCESSDADAIKDTINDDDWGSVTVDKIVRWGNDRIKGEGYPSGETGLAAPPVKQDVYLSFAPHGNSSIWKEMLKLTINGFTPTNMVFSPHTLDAVNIQISTGGNQNSPRTDVVVDDVKFSQWAAESSEDDIQSGDRWAFTDAWITRVVGDGYQGAGSREDDVVAIVEDCGYRFKQLSDTEYIYIFTNTSGKAVSFLPKQDMTIHEMFILGGGGGGGPGGGGGGGGSAVWITNTVEYLANETGMKICVGQGGTGGSSVYENANPEVSSSGGNSYVTVKRIDGGEVTYQGYGGGRGGTFKDGAEDGGDANGKAAGGGGSARKANTRSGGNADYGAGFGGAAADGAPGGGGGGGLRGVGDDGGNTPLNNGRSVIHAGTNGYDAAEGLAAGFGGNGFEIKYLGDSEIKKAIVDLLGDRNDGWLGGGGGGGSGLNLDGNKENWGTGAYTFGSAGKGGGGQGGEYTNPDKAEGADGVPFTGGGGGGGSFSNPVSSGGQVGVNQIKRGGDGGCGLVVLRVKIRDRLALLQPMRGSENKPMSIRTPFLNGISLFSFSWKDAHSNAVLKVQVVTNGVDVPPSVTDGNIGSLTQDLNVRNLWVDFGEPIRFKDMDDDMRRQGATNILIGLRAPISGIVRLLVDPDIVAEARKGATNNLDSMYGSVVITGMKVFDEPELDDRSWWGWNIMPTSLEAYSSLYDPVTLGPGRSLGLNFSGVLSKDDVHKGSNPDYDTEFADDNAVYNLHNPFVQTPRFTNGIGSVMFKARMTETNSQESGWITISASTDPNEETDKKWDVLTNIEVTASTTVFEPFFYRLTNSVSSYQALRLTAWGAAEGRYNSDPTNEKQDPNHFPLPPEPFGTNGTSNPVPVQRVLIDEVLVTQPIAPRISLKNAYPFRHGTREFASVPAAKIASPDEQPLLGETFGMQVQVVPAGMEDELDVESIRVYMAWHAGDSPWGYKNWENEKYTIDKVELKPASDWSVDNLVYRSHPEDANAFIPPQMAGENGYQIVQYHIWAEYKSKNGSSQFHHISNRDWVRPSWYLGIEDPNERPGNVFCPYTVLYSISPKRAWFNEINVYDGVDTGFDTNQYIEVAAPQGFDMTGWRIECIKNTGEYKLFQAASFGDGNVIPLKTADAVNKYAFIAIQSPKTKNANTHKNLNDGTWLSSAFDVGEVLRSPYALRLSRPNGVIEHEVVFMSTNASSSFVSYIFEGTNLLKEVTARYPDSDFIYAGADAYSGSLGVYTNHGESASCWTNTMQQTPGRINRMADGTLQYINPNYFEPPSGTNLWIYANIAPDSVNSLSMVFGTVTNTSMVVIVPQGMDGTFSTSIVYVVKKWFTMDKVVTNEVGKAGGTAAVSPLSQDASGNVWTLDLNGLKLSDPESRMFEVTASTRDSDKISNLPEGKGIAKDDPYYPAVVDWLQNYDEKDIRLAEFWCNSRNEPVTKDDGSKYLLSLKQMYWLNIDPVGRSNDPDDPDGNSEWALKGGMSHGPLPIVSVTNSITGTTMTNIRCVVTMMITNLVDAALTRAPDMLRGLEPGSTSSNYNERLPGNEWDSVTFKITGALQNGKVGSIYRPLRWFTFGPDSFSPTNGYTREIDVPDPFSSSSPGFSYGWYKYPDANVFYRWAINHDTNRPPFTVYQLNDENALLEPRDDAGSGNGN